MITKIQTDQFNTNPFINQNDTKGNDCIVVQIGSESIKFGFASQYAPFVIPNVIAYKTKSKIEKDIKNEEKMEIEIENEGINEDLINENNKNNNNISDEFLSCLLKIEQEIVKKENKNKMAKKLALLNSSNNPNNIKIQNSINEIPERVNEQIPNSTSSYKKMYQMSLDLNEDIVNNNFKWTSLNENPLFLIGKEALCIPDSINDYIIRNPIQFGYFNNEYPYYEVVDDLELILNFCFEQVLKIEPKNYNQYNIVLIIPDIFIKVQVKNLVNVFLKYFGFKNIFLHLESVMSTFGLAVQSSCIVDIGSDKINICCIDEGVILEETIIRKNFGGNDITNLLYLLIKQNAKRKNNENNFPYELFDMNNKKHFRIFEKLKENECEFPPILDTGLGTTQLTPKNSKIWFHQKGLPTKLISFTLIEEAYIAPLCLFYPEIIKTFKKTEIPKITYDNDITGEIYKDPEDTLDDLIKFLNTEDKKDDNNSDNNILLTTSKKTNNYNISSNNSEDSLSNSHSKSDDGNNSLIDEQINKKNTYEAIFDINEGIDDLICKSLMSVASEELRKKLANSIMLVGGTTKIKGFIDFLEDRLINKLSQLDNEIERVEIFNYPEIDLKTLSWIGGTIIPKLESAKDMWIQRERWLGEPERIDEEKNDKDKKDNKKNKDDNINNNNNNNNNNIIKEGNEKKDNKIMSNVKGKDNNKNKSERKDDVKNKKDDIKKGEKPNKKDDKDKDKNENKEGVKRKKNDRHLDGGIKLIREKCPFSW